MANPLFHSGPIEVGAGAIIFFVGAVRVIESLGLSLSHLPVIGIFSVYALSLVVGSILLILYMKFKSFKPFMYFFFVAVLLLIIYTTFFV